MATTWIAEWGVHPAAAKIAPAARMAIAGGGIVSFVEDGKMTLSAFEQACAAAELDGVYTGDQEDADLERVCQDIAGYGDNDDAQELDALGVEGLGAFFFADSKAQAEDKAAAFLLGKAYAESAGTRMERTGWQRLARKIAVVTGSAQGFGDGIAREMVSVGCHVVIADLNYDLARQNAEEINALHGRGMAVAARVDVTDEASVAAMLESCVLAFGGLDVFVSNAGVLKAGGLEEMTLKDFEFVTRVNYTAFYLCTKYASRVMKWQHRFAPDYGMDIVQINSKSGLEGSYKNFTYAGGKFGGIGLVASFAKELVGERIKVNAICPGNFYEGPLWSDPEKGLFRQYLEAGKVAGAKTTEDVRAHYISQVPMRRGCYPRDVAQAIYYCMEQQYETGQAVPVTGGQVMLH